MNVDKQLGVLCMKLHGQCQNWEMCTMPKLRIINDGGNEKHNNSEKQKHELHGGNGKNEQ